jgi:YidC/Oxa1 family membrane protein insertase
MNKQEKTIVALLFLGLLGWYLLQPPRPSQPPPRPPAADTVADRPAAAEPPAGDSAPLIGEEAVTGTDRPVAELEPAAAEEPLAPARIETLSNDVLSLDMTSHGAAVVAVRLQRYPLTLAEDSAAVNFDFSAMPALALSGIQGLSARHDFSLTRVGETIVAEREVGNGLFFRRTVALTNGYQALVTDTFSNRGTAPLSIPEHSFGTGPMEAIRTKAQARGQSFLELNALGWKSGSHVERWRDKEFAEMLGARSGGGCSQPNVRGLETGGSARHREELAWGAAKNRFFVQILAPQDGAAGCTLQVERQAEATSMEIASVSLAMLFPAFVLEPGTEVSRVTGYYAGPTKYSELKALGGRQDRVMLHAYRGWGWFRSLSIGLLWLLNRLHDLIPNYGVAIILLTLLVRIVFWPVTSKSTADQRRMRELQPQMKLLKDKFKDDPKRMQAETWALYRKHKVNPMTSCLPMLLQMPFFIALFNILRSAVELRFASFLWVSDLSEPERLLEGVLPFGLVLNILPLLMTATTFFQQKMMPAGGDPAQQRMMLFMPLIMLFFFYNFAAALALYWTVSQGLAILQMVMQRKQTAKG